MKVALNTINQPTNEKALGWDLKKKILLDHDWIFLQLLVFKHQIENILFLPFFTEGYYLIWLHQ